VAASDAEVRKGQARAASQLILGEGNQEGGISGTKGGTIALGPRDHGEANSAHRKKSSCQLLNGVHSSLNVVCGGASKNICSETRA
jgi:hypothetical protein